MNQEQGVVKLWLVSTNFKPNLIESIKPTQFDLSRTENCLLEFDDLDLNQSNARVSIQPVIAEINLYLGMKSVILRSTIRVSLWMEFSSIKNFYKIDCLLFSLL